MSVPAPAPRSPPTPCGPSGAGGCVAEGQPCTAGRARGGQGCWPARLVARCACALVRAGPTIPAPGVLTGLCWVTSGGWGSAVRGPFLWWLHGPRTQTGQKRPQWASARLRGSPWELGAEPRPGGAGFPHLANHRNQMRDLVRRRRPLRHARLGRGPPALLPAPSRPPCHPQGGFRRRRPPLGAARGCRSRHGQPPVGTAAAACGGSLSSGAGAQRGPLLCSPPCARSPHPSPFTRRDRAAAGYPLKGASSVGNRTAKSPCAGVGGAAGGAAPRASNSEKREGGRMDGCETGSEVCGVGREWAWTPVPEGLRGPGQSWQQRSAGALAGPTPGAGRWCGLRECVQTCVQT